MTRKPKGSSKAAKPVRAMIQIRPGEMKEVALVPVTVKRTEGGPIVYRLSDGSAIELQVVPMSIRLAVGEYDGFGNPIYVVQTANAMSVTSPKSLRKKPK